VERTAHIVSSWTVRGARAMSLCLNKTREQCALATHRPVVVVPCTARSGCLSVAGVARTTAASPTRTTAAADREGDNPPHIAATWHGCTVTAPGAPQAAMRRPPPPCCRAGILGTGGLPARARTGAAPMPSPQPRTATRTPTRGACWACRAARPTRTSRQHLPGLRSGCTPTRTTTPLPRPASCA
jgi:hypothetical protein